MHLTVVMSVLNGERHLFEAVESVLNQTHQDYTFLIVNNGSTDQTGDIVEDFATRDSRVVPIHIKKTVSYVEGRQIGFDRAETEWVALMDADDISESKRFERQLKVISEYGNSIGAIGTWGHYINEKGRVLGNLTMEPTSKEKFQRMFVANEAIVLTDPSSIIHLPTFYNAGGYRPECVPAADLDLWYRIAEQGRMLQVVPEYLFRYRVHSGSDSVRRTMLQRKKTHFINFNMRRRRFGDDELSWQSFLDKQWSSWLYRCPRLYRDLGMTFYKNAGLRYGEGNYVQSIFYLLITTILIPSFVIKRLYRQKFSSAQNIDRI